MRNVGALTAHLRIFTFSAAERGTADDRVKRRCGANAAAAKRIRWRARLAPGSVRGHAAIADGAVPHYDNDDDPVQASEVGGPDALDVDADACGPNGVWWLTRWWPLSRTMLHLRDWRGAMSRQCATCDFHPSRPTTALWHAAL